MSFIEEVVFSPFCILSFSLGKQMHRQKITVLVHSSYEFVSLVYEQQWLSASEHCNE